MKKLLVLVALFVLCVVQGAAAENVTINIEWKQVLTEDFGGWNVYMSDTPTVLPIESNLLTKITYAGAPQEKYTSAQPVMVAQGTEKKLYFILTAFDEEGNESEPSNEVSATMDFLPPDSPFGLIISVVKE